MPPPRGHNAGFTLRAGQRQWPALGTKVGFSAKTVGVPNPPFSWAPSGCHTGAAFCPAVERTAVVLCPVCGRFSVEGHGGVLRGALQKRTAAPSRRSVLCARKRALGRDFAPALRSVPCSGGVLLRPHCGRSSVEGNGGGLFCPGCHGALYNRADSSSF
jgi:hypothetical protein